MAARRRWSRDATETALARVVEQKTRSYLGRVLDEARAALRGRDPSRGRPVVVLGLLLDWWTEDVAEPVVEEIRAAWARAFEATTTTGTAVLNEHADTMALHLAAVKDRLSRTARPEIPTAAFEQVRLSQSAAALGGWDTSRQARDIAERLAWEPDKEYWKQVKAFAEREIDRILDPLGRPGTPARTIAHKNDPDVRRWQEVRADAVDKIREDESDWITRATRIARTESTAVWNSGALAALAAEGVRFKEWLATEDSRTREEHRHADGQVVPITVPFTVGGVAMMMPGDPAAPPHLSVNCRCTVVGAETPQLAALTAAASQHWRDQLRIPRGNRRLSGRWTYTPWKHFDDLAGLLNSFGRDEFPETRAAVRSALEGLSGFDPNALDVHDATLMTAAKDAADALRRAPRTGDRTIDDALDEAEQGVSLFADADWSLFEEASDVGAGDGMIGDAPAPVTPGRAVKNLWEGPLPDDAAVDPAFEGVTSEWLASELLRIKNHPVAPSPTARRKRASYIKELNDRRDRDAAGGGGTTPAPAPGERPFATDTAPTITGSDTTYGYPVVDIEPTILRFKDGPHEVEMQVSSFADAPEYGEGQILVSGVKLRKDGTPGFQAFKPRIHESQIPPNVLAEIKRLRGGGETPAVAYPGDTPVSDEVGAILDTWVQQRGSGLVTPEQVGALRVAVITKGEPSPTELWRGANMTQIGALMYAGQALDFPPASASTDPGAAEPYAENGEGKPVLFRFPAGTKGLNVSGRAEAVGGYAEEEWVTAGRFYVNGVTEEDGIWVVNLSRSPGSADAAQKRADKPALDMATYGRPVAETTPAPEALSLPEVTGQETPERVDGVWRRMTAPPGNRQGRLSVHKTADLGGEGKGWSFRFDEVTPVPYTAQVDGFPTMAAAKTAAVALAQLWDAAPRRDEDTPEFFPTTLAESAARHAVLRDRPVSSLDDVSALLRDTLDLYEGDANITLPTGDGYGRSAVGLNGRDADSLRLNLRYLQAAADQAEFSSWEQFQSNVLGWMAGEGSLTGGPPLREEWVGTLQAILDKAAPLWADLDPHATTRAEVVEVFTRVADTEGALSLSDVSDTVHALQQLASSLDRDYSLSTRLTRLAAALDSENLGAWRKTVADVGAFMRAKGPAWGPVADAWQRAQDRWTLVLEEQAAITERDLLDRYGTLPPEQRTPDAVIADVSRLRFIGDVGRNNCVLASTAYELRRRGIQAMPKGAKKGRNSEQAQYAWFHVTGDNARRVPGLKGRQMPARYRIIAEAIASEVPPGARGTIRCSWKGRNFGHIWNWERGENGVYFIDPQTGEYIGPDRGDYWREADWNSVTWARLDDKPLKADIEAMMVEESRVSNPEIEADRIAYEAAVATRRQLLQASSDAWHSGDREAYTRLQMQLREHEARVTSLRRAFEQHFQSYPNLHEEINTLDALERTKERR